MQRAWYRLTRVLGVALAITMILWLSSGRLFTSTSSASQIVRECIALRAGVWSDPTVWSCGIVPGAANNVTIPVTATVSVNVAALASDVTIQPGGGLTMVANSSLTVIGDFSNAGTFTANGGEVVFNGGGQTQHLTLAAPTTFHRLTIASGARVVEVLSSAAKTTAPQPEGFLTVAEELVVGGTFTGNSAFHDIHILGTGVLNALPQSTVTVSGDFSNAGTFTANGGEVIFNGGGQTQHLTLAAPTTFHNLTVSQAALLVETVATDNATVAGSLTNQGTIRKQQIVTDAGPRTFGLAGWYNGAALTLNVTAPGDLTSLQVDRRDTTHPNAAIGELTERYWRVTPGGADFSMDITLPHALPDDKTASACRHTGEGNQWDCTRRTATPNTVVSTAVTATSDWAVGAVSVIVTPRIQQYSDEVTFTARLATQNIIGLAPDAYVSFTVGAQVMGTAPLTRDGDTLIGELMTTLVEPAPASMPDGGELAPGVHIVTAHFYGVQADHPVDSPKTSLLVTAENAVAEYSGLYTVAPLCADCATATATLVATVYDITSIPVNPDFDLAPGDVRNAIVTFWDRDTNTPLPGCIDVPVGLVVQSDSQVGTATCDWQFDSRRSPDTRTLGIVTQHYYTRDAASEDFTVRLKRQVGGFVSGSGYLLVTNAAGRLAGDPGTTLDFDFDLAQDRTGLAFERDVTLTFRRQGHVYQLRSQRANALVVDAGSSTATFTGSATLHDITNPTRPTLLDDDATLQLTMTDRGLMGWRDTLGITVLDEDGGLWFSNDWGGRATVEQLISRGDLRVRN